MTSYISAAKLALLTIVAALFVGGPAFALPGATPPNRRPKMPPKPTIQGIPNGGRQGAWQPQHGAFGNVSGSSAAGQTGQTGQFGQGGFGGGALGGFASGGGFGGGALGGAIGGGAIGGGLGGGGMKGLGIGGGLFGPEPSYQKGVGIYGGAPALDGLTSDQDSLPASRRRPTYHALMLSPVVTEVLNRR